MSWQELYHLYDIHNTSSAGGNLGARQNIAPTQQIAYCALSDGQRELQVARWGLLPHWAKDTKSKPMINARAETIREKPMFKRAFETSRCLIPADGFYEWTIGEDGKKDPHHIHLSHQVFSFAGILTVNKNLGPEPIVSCAIITMTPPIGSVMASIHNRMPVIANEDVWEEYLDPATGSDRAFDLLSNNLGAELRAYRVSRNVNSWKYDGIDCIDKVSA